MSRAKPDDTDAQIALAQNLIAANRADEARPVLEALKAKEPANAVATLGLIDLALARNDAEGALKLADALRQANPIAAAQLRSSVLLRTNRPDEAIQAMEQALQATPDRHHLGSTACAATMAGWIRRYQGLRTGSSATPTMCLPGLFWPTPT